MQEEFKPIVKRANGFEYLPERPAAEGFMRQKWGWRGTKPGACCYVATALWLVGQDINVRGTISHVMH